VRIDASDVCYCWLHLFTCLRRLEVPFIGPRGLGAVGSNPGRQFLPSVGWRTGQSGAPSDIHCSLSGADLLPKLAQSTVADLEPLAHQTQSGAHRTIRCSHLTVGSATRHMRIARPTVGPTDRWLIGQSGAPPDSLVNFSRTPSTNSRERPVDQTPACTTGHCPVHPDCAESWLLQPSLFPFVFSLLFFFFLFLTLRQIC
jgi:hypothetical protein